MWRTVRWLDRCIEVHEKSGRNDIQNLFAIVQGGVDHELRDQCLEEMIRRKDRVAGYAIGGLSGGEAKGLSLNVRNLYLPRLKKFDHRRVLENASQCLFLLSPSEG